MSESAEPFTRQDALARGLTDRQLRGPAYRQLHTGVYIPAWVEVTPEVAARAALLPFGGRAFASHTTAARLWRLPIPTSPDEHVTVTLESHRRRRSGITCHVGAGGSVKLVRGVPVSAVERTFVELCSLLPLVEAVVVGDHLVRHGLISREGLVRFCASSRLAGAAKARVAVGLVRERVDSPMETRVRMLLVLAGLPEPRVNETVADEGLVDRRKYDLCWPEAKLIVEYDGRHHIERVKQWRSDLRRREGIDDDGWRIIVLIAEDVYKTPGETLARIHRVLLARHCPGTPRLLNDRWRRHFPGR